MSQLKNIENWLKNFNAPLDKDQAVEVLREHGLDYTADLIDMIDLDYLYNVMLEAQEKQDVILAVGYKLLRWLQGDEA